MEDEDIVNKKIFGKCSGETCSLCIKRETRVIYNTDNFWECFGCYNRFHYDEFNYREECDGCGSDISFCIECTSQKNFHERNCNEYFDVHRDSPHCDKCKEIIIKDEVCVCSSCGEGNYHISCVSICEECKKPKSKSAAHVTS